MAERDRFIDQYKRTIRAYSSRVAVRTGLRSDSGEERILKANQMSIVNEARENGVPAGEIADAALDGEMRGKKALDVLRRLKRK